VQGARRIDAPSVRGGKKGGGGCLEGRSGEKDVVGSVGFVGVREKERLRKESKTEKKTKGGRGIRAELSGFFAAKKIERRGMQRRIKRASRGGGRASSIGRMRMSRVDSLELLS